MNCRGCHPLCPMLQFAPCSCHEHDQWSKCACTWKGFSWGKVTKFDKDGDSLRSAAYNSVNFQVVPREPPLLYKVGTWDRALKKRGLDTLEEWKHSHSKFMLQSVLSLSNERVECCQQPYVKRFVSFNPFKPESRINVVVNRISNVFKRSNSKRITASLSSSAHDMSLWTPLYNYFTGVIPLVEKSHLKIIDIIYLYCHSLCFRSRWNLLA